MCRASVQDTEQWAGPIQTEKNRPQRIFYFKEELSKWSISLCAYGSLFLTLHYAWGPRISTFVWPDVVYLNFMFKNDLVTCVKYKKSHNEGNRYWYCYYVQMLSLNNYRGNIFLYF